MAVQGNAEPFTMPDDVYEALGNGEMYNCWLVMRHHLRDLLKLSNDYSTLPFLQDAHCYSINSVFVRDDDKSELQPGIKSTLRWMGYLPKLVGVNYTKDIDKNLLRTSAPKAYRKASKVNYYLLSDRQKDEDQKSLKFDTSNIVTRHGYLSDLGPNALKIDLDNNKDFKKVNRVYVVSSVIETSSIVMSATRHVHNKEKTYKKVFESQRAMESKNRPFPLGFRLLELEMNEDGTLHRPDDGILEYPNKTYLPEMFNWTATNGNGTVNKRVRSIKVFGMPISETPTLMSTPPQPVPSDKKAKRKGFRRFFRFGF